MIILWIYRSSSEKAIAFMNNGLYKQIFVSIPTLMTFWAGEGYLDQDFKTQHLPCSNGFCFEFLNNIQISKTLSALQYKLAEITIICCKTMVKKLRCHAQKRSKKRKKELKDSRNQPKEKRFAVCNKSAGNI